MPQEGAVETVAVPVARCTRWWQTTSFVVGVLAIILTLTNTIKPLVIDDAAFYQYARQISQHPSDPYGFELYWFQQPQAANRV